MNGANDYLIHELVAIKNDFQSEFEVAHIASSTIASFYPETSETQFCCFVSPFGYSQDIWMTALGVLGGMELLKIHCDCINVNKCWIDSDITRAAFAFGSSEKARETELFTFYRENIVSLRNSLDDDLFRS